MSDESDFAIDAGDLQPPADLPAESAAVPAPALEPDATPPPLVVIQYRSRGLHATLLPPLLILLVALGIASYQRQARLRPVAPPPTAPAPKADTPAAGPRRVIMVAPSGTGAAVDPITVRDAISPPLPPPPDPNPNPNPNPNPDLDLDPAPALTPAPSTVVAAVAPAEPKAEEALAHAEGPLEPGPFSPFAPVAEEGPQPSPARPALDPPAPLVRAAGEELPADSPELAFRVVAERSPGPPAEPGPTKEQVLRDIQAEAEEKLDEQKHLEREVADSKVRELWETVRKAQAERRKFHDELRGLLRELGIGAGEEINALCDRYGRTLHPDIHNLVKLELNRSAARLNREAKIRLMRARGVPEANILDFLSNSMHNQINTRGGPRDQNEVRVWAARLLLSYPPPAPAAPSARPTGTTSARTPSAPRAMAGVAAPRSPRAARPSQ